MFIELYEFSKLVMHLNSCFMGLDCDEGCQLIFARFSME